MTTAFRNNIFDLLKLISSSQRQFDYENKVPVANVPAELICMWFDDLYQPTSDLFLRSFNENEVADLSQFNEFFNARVNAISMNNGVLGLQNDSNWLEVQFYASALLKKYDDSTSYNIQS
jgi:hypothetical protein